MCEIMETIKSEGKLEERIKNIRSVYSKLKDVDNEREHFKFCVN